FRARYVGIGPISGEERIAFANDHLIAEQRLDGAPDTVWDLELGKSGRGARMHVTGDGLDVTVTRDGGKARLTGTAGHAPVSGEEAIADDEIFGGAPVGIDAAFHRTLMTLPQG